MNKVQNRIFYFLFFVCISCSVYSNDNGGNNDTFVAEHDSIIRSIEKIEYEIEKDRLMVQYEVKSLSDRYSSFSDKISIFESDTNSKIKSLNDRISKIDAQLTDLTSRYKVNNSTNTSTIVLTAVSVLVTVLGVMIAILAVFGYRDLKENAIEVAEKTSVERIQVYLSEHLNEEVKNGIVSVVKDNKVNEEIEEIFMKIALQGIYAGNNSEDED